MATSLNLARFTRSSDADCNVEAMNGNCKRPRLNSSNYSEFQPGALIKLRLENFVTYEFTEFDLSPSLNMIIGPNGSGKSTFVCAICIGLAGKPQYIGRSKRIDDFIKNGKDRGMIEITLRNSPNLRDITSVNADDEVIKVTRHLLRSKTKSEYYINDTPVPESMVKLLVFQLNIQLDNLCQFMSQERVASFAGLKADKLLVETLRSIDTNLCTALETLKELQTDEVNSQKDLESKKKRHRDLTAQREKLNDSVRAFQEYQNKRDEVDVHKMLLPYVQIKDHKEKLRTYKMEYDQAKANLKKFLSDKIPFRESQNRVKEAAKEAAGKLELAKRGLDRSEEIFHNKTRELTNVKEEIKDLKKKNAYYRNRAEHLKTEKERKVRLLNENRDHLARIELPDPQLFEDIKTQRDDLICEERRIKNTLVDLDARMSNANYSIKRLKQQIENRAKSLNNNDRIGILDGLASQSSDSNNVFEVLKSAVHYVRSTPQMRGKVFEPPILSVTVKNPNYASYLAQCVDYNTQNAFTIIDSTAFEEFGNDILRRFPVNTRELRGTEAKRPLTSEQIKEFGFDFYLSDVVVGDPVVIKMLCQKSKINLIPVCTKELRPEQIDKLTKPMADGKILFKKFIHGSRVVDLRRSEYTKQIFTTEYNVRPTNSFKASIMSDDQIHAVKNDISQLESKCTEWQSKLEDLTTERRKLAQNLSATASETERLRTRTSDLNRIREEFSLTETTIDSLTKEIDKLDREARKDVSKYIKMKEAEIASKGASQTKIIRELVSSMSSLNKYRKELIISEIDNFEVKNMDFSLNDVIGSFNQKEEDLKREYEDKKQKAKEAKNTPEYRSWLSQIKSYDEEIKKRLHDYAERYENEGRFNLSFVQDTVFRLESDIAMLNHDESAVTILAQVEKELEQLERVIPQDVEKLKKIKVNLKKNLALLEPRLDEIVSRISSKFKDLFKVIGSKGHIKLDKPNLFSEWKIQIMVSFRENAGLRELDARTQSGGERAVSTVLYMIALQQFSSAPFRVVDEINQGMDSNNERIVHKSMVENACAENTSQYFLITPKLLTNLYYHEKMMIHCVMAGSWIPDPTERPEMATFGQLSKFII